jgi:monomeric isocitrate dehydrogenase
LVAEPLRKDEVKIFVEPPSVHGQAIDIGGNHHPDEAKVEAPMWPGATPNRVPE